MSCACVCLRACMCVCVCACVRACVRACVHVGRCRKDYLTSLPSLIQGAIFTVIAAHRSTTNLCECNSSTFMHGRMLSFVTLPLPSLPLPSPPLPPPPITAVRTRVSEGPTVCSLLSLYSACSTYVRTCTVCEVCTWSRTAGALCAVCGTWVTLLYPSPLRHLTLTWAAPRVTLPPRQPAPLLPTKGSTFPVSGWVVRCAWSGEVECACVACLCEQ